ncbi:MAG: DUF4215 domain-containing protein [bacterium]
MRTLVAIVCLSMLACGGDSGPGGGDSGVGNNSNLNVDGGGDDDGGASSCGDGVVDVAAGEDCDDGEDNSDLEPGACRTNCTAAGCGDDVIDAGEECDDGGDNSDEPNAFCRTDCRWSRCGDGVVDAAEGCDDGNNDPDDGCSASCQYEVTCGAMIVDGVALAMDGLYLGDTDWQAVSDPNAWELYGANLDGLITTATDTTGHCVAYAGASPAAVFPDGPGGLDNSFGRNVVPLLLGVLPSLSQETNAIIDNGQTTLLLLLEPILSPNMTGLYANLYGGAPLSAAPLWNGTDCWPVRREDLTDPSNITSAVMQFTDSTVANDFWESGDTTTLTLSLKLGSVTLPLTVHEARLELQLAAGYSSGTDGVIAGVIDTEELVELVRDALGATDPGQCTGAAFSALADQLRQASDIMGDGTQDPTATCDAISIGLGFTMAEVRLGEIAPPATPPANPCP